MQVYFRYPSPAASDGDQRSVSHQLVQCVYKKTSYPSPIQVSGSKHQQVRVHRVDSVLNRCQNHHIVTSEIHIQKTPID